MSALLKRHSLLVRTRKLVAEERQTLGDLASDGAVRAAVVKRLITDFQRQPDALALCAHLLCDLAMDVDSPNPRAAKPSQ